MQDVLINLAQWVRPYQSQCAMAIVATLLVLFGGEISKAIRQLIRHQHLMIRTFIFVLVCAFGYGALTIWLSKVLTQWIAIIPDVYLAPTVLSVFMLLGLYAQKQKQI
ncbi:DUF3392 domain-containing protein [Thalassotalea euphylliae]|uniref:DUF3392 domain-containing protein n=1 Tax=Thalassotalea euphylliae TaxID=1655234 RepID=UPI003626C0D7